MQDLETSLQIALERFGLPLGAACHLASNAHVVAYERAATIFHTGEPADLLYIILSGEVKLYYLDAAGARLLVAICRRGELLGSLAGGSVAEAQNEGTQLFTAEALSRCKIAIVTKSRATAAVRELGAPETLTLLRRVDREWAHFSSRFLSFLMMDVRSRLTYAITHLADKFGIADPRGKLIPFRLSHEDFGEFVGASRPMVSKHLKELARAGIFYKENGRYILSHVGVPAAKVASYPGTARHSGVNDRGTLQHRRRGLSQKDRIPVAV